MQNRWLLLLVVLMVFINNESFAQDAQEEGGDDGPAYLDEAWTIRSYPDFPNCRTCWLTDTDFVYSEQKQKVKASIILAPYFHKATNQTIDSLIAIGASSKTDQVTRIQTIMSLAYIVSTRQIPFLENMINTETCDTCDGIRWTCIETLMEANSISSIPLLIKTLAKETDYQIRLEIADFLAKNGEKTYSFQTLKSIWGANLKLKTSCHQGFLYINTPESINIIRTDMKDSDAVVALDAAAIMAELNYKDEAFPVLTELLHNDNPFVRMSAMKVLAWFIGDEKSFDLIKQMQNDTDWYVREYCLAIMNKYQIK